MKVKHVRVENGVLFIESGPVGVAGMELRMDSEGNPDELRISLVTPDPEVRVREWPAEPPIDF